METAEPIARRLNLPLCQSNELGEMRVGEWEGRLILELDQEEEWCRFNAYRSGVRAPGGELMIETQTRMVRFVDVLSHRHEQESIAIVSHGDPIRSVLAHFMGLHIDLMQRLEISPASMSIVQLDKWSPKILLINATRELAA